MAVPKINQPATTTLQTISSVTTKVTSTRKISIRLQFPTKPKIVTATTTTATKIFNSEGDSQDIDCCMMITTARRTITQILLQHGTVTSQKITLNQTADGIKK
jgi:hypothetical protein